MEGENGLFAPQYGLILCLLPLVSSAYAIIVCFNQCFLKNWGYVSSYSAQIWENDEWKTVYEGEEFSKDMDIYVPLESDVTTTKFRLLFHDGETLSETVSISEIKIYGK